MHRPIATTMLLSIPLWSSIACGDDRSTVDDPVTVTVDGRAYEVRDRGIAPLDANRPFDPLLPSTGLEGWSVVGGDAWIDRVGDEIHGRGEAARNTFLISDASYSDFVLEGEVLINEGGNSGWQVRSRRVDPDDPRTGVRGYQIEVDSSERSWSGGLYDELRRGWIHPMNDDPRSRGAFRTGEWNHYRIECVGPRVRSWVNGVPCADVIDFADGEGSIAFQVHSGRCAVKWRGLRIKRLPGIGDGSNGRWMEDGDGGTSMRRRELPDGDVTVVTGLRVDQRTEVLIEDGNGKDLLRIGFGPDLEPVASSVPGTSGALPVTTAGAGVERLLDGRRSLILDIEQGRLVLLVDGRVVVRSLLSDDEKPATITIMNPVEDGDGPNDTDQSERTDHDTNP